ncbi:MAG TPA: phosphate/phosphite/phosphonate ABC transporter substrate-binding protein, partial [Gammaproteobacteria bacterium]|nr:phosphate/phosphite/phosphonate ABC transporter substrate-binding protein [Gammaproteobacteria bacterium]
SLHETDGFFSKVLRSGSHEESIRMVAEGKAQASAVDSLVLDYDRLHNPEFVSQVRIIKSLGPAAIPPVVASTTLPEKEFQLIQDVLLGMANDPKGKAILDSAGVKRFEKVTDDFYDDIRAMRDLAKKTGFSQIQ